jgi:hypothetical protein
MTKASSRFNLHLKPTFWQNDLKSFALRTLAVVDGLEHAVSRLFITSVNARWKTRPAIARPSPPKAAALPRSSGPHSAILMAEFCRNRQ